MYTDLRTGSHRFIIIFQQIHALGFISSKKILDVGQQQEKIEPR